MYFIKIISLLPFPVLYIIADVLYLVLFYLTKYRKKVVFYNLRIAFPNSSAGEINQIAKAFYKNLCDIIVETFKANSISPAELTKRVKITNIQLINEYYDKQVPVIVMTSHLCNWEWLLLSNCILLKYPVDAVYKRLKNKRFDFIMKKIRSRFGANLIEKNSLIREVARKRNIPRIVAMVSDQTPASSVTNKWYKLFNKKIPFYTGAEKIAQMTNYPVLFVAMTRIKRGFYEVTFEKMGEPPYSENPRLIEKYISLIEKEIIGNPANWLWSHKRWKHSRE